MPKKARLNKKVKKQKDSEVSPMRMKLTMLVFAIGPLLGIWLFLQKQGFFQRP